MVLNKRGMKIVVRLQHQVWVAIFIVKVIGQNANDCDFDAFFIAFDT